MVFYLPIMGSVAIGYLALAFLMTAVIFILGFVKLTILDYATLFACFSCIVRFVRLSPLFFGSALPVFYIFIVILAVFRLRSGRLTGHLFHVWFATTLTVIASYTANTLFNYYVAGFGLSFESDIVKLMVWGGATLAIVALCSALIYVIKRGFGKRFREINEMGRAYPRIERYFIYNSAVILLLTMPVYTANILLFSYSHRTYLAFNLFLLVAQAIQFSFLILIFRMTWLKDNLQSKTLESQNLADYSSNLEKSFDEIKGIKHDIKNIFITMGGYVERSGDQEMQEFFREKISPFVHEEIAKSDLLGKLALVNSEPIKTLLWYKISQAAEHGIVVDLDISPAFSTSAVFSSSMTKMEPADLVRILGILLDNAIEECLALPDGIISVRLAQNDEIASYMIKNTVSDDKKETGIKAGISSKGDGRGKGLLIVRGLLEKYNFVTLNSYFRDDSFVQSLTEHRIDSDGF